MTEFRGFPPELFTFFEEPEKENSKSFSDAHKQVWEEQVRAPMRALLDFDRIDAETDAQRREVNRQKERLVGTSNKWWR